MSSVKTITPKYCHHKSSGRAYVTLAGRRSYLGSYESPESWQRYHRLIAEWQTAGCPKSDRPSVLLIDDLIVQYLKHADHYYRKRGKPTSEVNAIKCSLQELHSLYGSSPAAEFGPTEFKAIRQCLIAKDLTRTTVNGYMTRILRMFKWAVSETLVNVTVFQTLDCIPSLRKGRSTARENPPVSPAKQEKIDAVLPLLPPPVATMVQLQLLTGMRSGEVTQMRPCDIDQSGEIWRYKPESHKTAHHGKRRIIPIGPRAQQLLHPYLDRESTAFLFCPIEAEIDRRKVKTGAILRSIQSGVTESERVYRRLPGQHYTTASYGRAVKRGCESAFPPPAALKGNERRMWCKRHHWHPHQLRHNFATSLCRASNLELTQKVLGHSSRSMTELYAERDVGMADVFMKEIG